MTPDELERVRIYTEKLQAANGNLNALTQYERIDLSYLVAKHVMEDFVTLHQVN